jgi:parallel beta-helix repeat protein
MLFNIRIIYIEIVFFLNIASSFFKKIQNLLKDCSFLVLMKQKAACILLLISISFCLLNIRRVECQSQDSLIINADGTVTPSTALIKQETNTYTLTGDFQGSVLVQRSNIILNGAGNTLQCLTNSEYGVKLLDVSNVTIKNMTIRSSSFGCIYGIELTDCKDCTVTNNTVTDVWSILGLNGILYAGVYVSGGGSNTFTRNTLLNNSLGLYFINTANNLITENLINYTYHSVNSSTSGVSFNNASGNFVYHNNFRAEVGAQAGAYASNNTWDNGYPSGGNYWIDYHSRYPNASMIGASGIGSIAYKIDDLNRDNYPLMTPFNASAIVETSPTPIVTPIAVPQQDNALLIGAIAVVVVIAIIGLVVYFNRRHH